MPFWNEYYVVKLVAGLAFPVRLSTSFLESVLYTQKLTTNRGRICLYDLDNIPLEFRIHKSYLLGPILDFLNLEQLVDNPYIVKFLNSFFPSCSSKFSSKSLCLTSLVLLAQAKFRVGKSFAYTVARRFSLHLYVFITKKAAHGRYIPTDRREELFASKRVSSRRLVVKQRLSLSNNSCCPVLCTVCWCQQAFLKLFILCWKSVLLSKCVHDTVLTYSAKKSRFHRQCHGSSLNLTTR